MPQKPRVKKSPVKIVIIDGKHYKVSEKTGKPSKVPLTRANNTMTEAQFRGWVLSGLRDRTMMWPPAQAAWKLHTRPNQSGTRHKLEHQCAHCKGWFVCAKVGIGKRARKTIELDHIVPCGGLSDFDKAPQWIEKAFVEISGFQKLCNACHDKKTASERRKDAK